LVQPNFGAIAEMAAHWDGWCGSCSRINRTDRSRTSGLNRCARDFAVAPSSHKVEPPVIPGRFIPSKNVLTARVHSHTLYVCMVNT
jgi:hypothetical protein